MPLAFEPPNPGYTLYIDEAGDTGLRHVRPLDPRGASEWLVIGAILVKSVRKSETVEWVRDLRKLVTGAQRPDLHFRLLSETRKAAICPAMALLPLRGFALLSNKKNMRGYRNRRAEEARPSTRDWFYNYCVRLMLERVTEYIGRRSMVDYSEIRHLEIVFSTRGGMRYSQTKSYYDILRNDARSGQTYLTKREIDWRVLHPHLVSHVSPIANAGVQLADVVASAFFQAANTIGPNPWSIEHAKQLRRIMAQDASGTQKDYSVVLQPTPPCRAGLTTDQEEIFRFYGYRF